MKTSVERIDETTVTLHVTVDADRVERAIDHAAREVAKEVRVPGFRPGKAPRRVLERRIGKDALLEEAARHAIPGLYQEAVEAEQLPVVGAPEFDVGQFADGQEATFSAKVEVRPDVEVPDYDGLQIPHPDWEVTDEEIDAQVDALRQRFAELETVGRPAQPGDHALISVSALRDGQPLEDASQDDTLYAVGDPSETDQELDRQVVGAKAGDILKFDDTLGPQYGELAGTEVAVTVIVKEVKATNLPDLDDDFAITASEFDTIEELRGSIAEEMGARKREQSRAELRGRVVEELLERAEIPVPQAMVSQEMEFRVGQLSQQAEAYGLDFEQFLQLSGQTTEEFVAQLKEQAERTVKAQLLIDAVGREADIEITEEDLDTEVRRQAERLGRPAAELAEFMTHPQRVGALVADAFRRKAIDHLLEHVHVLSAPPPESAFAGEDDAAQPDDEDQPARAGAEQDDDDAASAGAGPEGAAAGAQEEGAKKGERGGSGG